MITIKLSLHGELVKYSENQSTVDIQIAEGNTIRQVIGSTSVPPEKIAFAAVNGSRAPIDSVVHDGDHIKLFQYVAGG